MPELKRNDQSGSNYRGGEGRLTGEDRGGTSIHVVTEFLACDFLGEGGGVHVKLHFICAGGPDLYSYCIITEHRPRTSYPGKQIYLTNLLLWTNVLDLRMLYKNKKNHEH